MQASYVKPSQCCIKVRIQREQHSWCLLTLNSCQACKVCIMCLQDFEKKEHKVKARAATNLAFLYALEGDTSSAERYANLAVGNDKYSAQALVNKVRHLKRKSRQHERAWKAK